MSDMDDRAVVVVDAKGAIHFWSPGAEKMFGHRSEDAVGRSVEILIPEFFREAHWAGFDAAIQRGAGTLSGEPLVVPAQAADGTVFPVEAALRLLCDSDGLAVGAVSVMKPQE
jgi:PAS domain S-box-containing protein